MSEQLDHDFKRLRWFFYQYLTWRPRFDLLTRFKIIAPNTILPNPTQPTGEDTEETALLVIKNRSESHLAAFWDAVMGYVPEDKREPNPFQPN